MSPERMMGSDVFLYALGRRRCPGRDRLLTETHRHRVHPRRHVWGLTHAWGPF